MSTIAASTLDLEKAVQVLRYVAARVPNLYHALKVLYFADREHLRRYGRFIYGETYIAMRLGPVPSTAYDIVKTTPPGFLCDSLQAARGQFEVTGDRISPKQEADLDYLSESDLECLDAAIRDYGNLSFEALRDASHDAAYEAAGENERMSAEDVARSFPNPAPLLAHLRGE
jgi:uncharacterized phage-associated protein